MIEARYFNSSKMQHNKKTNKKSPLASKLLATPHNFFYGLATNELCFAIGSFHV